MTLQAEKLTPCQDLALDRLMSSENVFVTGGAGSGKSFLIERFLRARSGAKKAFPILASTGAAAVLVGGRTFHSFFGLGILEGGPEETVKRALKNKRLLSRLKKIDGVIIDEVSMLGGRELSVAEQICRSARDCDEPWGGARIIVVGDFSQLPPVSRFAEGGTMVKDWAFKNPVWHTSEFSPALLQTIVRAKDPYFLEMLNLIRVGQINGDVQGFLNSRALTIQPEKFTGTRLFPHRASAERYNLEALEKLPGTARVFQTDYSGDQRMIESLKKNAPIGDLLAIKEGALVMLRQNDPEGRWVNGSLAHVKSIKPDRLEVTLMRGKDVEIEQTTFTLLNADGAPVAAATNFPVSLAYATTIHKAQGTTLDRVLVDLRGAWEHGQAYVALSRVRTPEGLFLEGWNSRSFVVDEAVRDFEASLLPR